MDGTIAITDHGWYDLLRHQPDLAEVNFWQPSARRTFNAPPFSPFLFKLRSPHNVICGYAYFARYSRLEDWLAWECFGVGNGCQTFAEMRSRIEAIRDRIRYRAGGEPTLIGCVLLVQPVFFEPGDWIEQPRDWPVRTQTTKRYDLAAGEGRRVWEACLARTPPMTEEEATRDRLTAAEASPRYGTPALVTPRLGQGTFRVAVSEAYGWGCAMSSEHSRPALDAAHIRPYAQDGPHTVENGLLLRADIHRLFDKGYITVTPELHVEVSRRLREDYSNGKTYYPLHGQTLHGPTSAAERPAANHLQWHNEWVYLG